MSALSSVPYLTPKRPSHVHHKRRATPLKQIVGHAAESSVVLIASYPGFPFQILSQAARQNLERKAWVRGYGFEVLLTHNTLSGTLYSKQPCIQCQNTQLSTLHTKDNLQCTLKGLPCDSSACWSFVLYFILESLVIHILCCYTRTNFLLGIY